MNLLAKFSRTSLAVAAFSLGAPTLLSQVAPTPPPTPAREATNPNVPSPPPNPPPRNSAENDRIVLTPFTVSSEKDVGFVATSSLAGGRMATALKDTPVAYSVLTSEFLEAFNITDAAEAAQWAPNSNFTMGDNTDAGFGTTPALSIRMRGVRVGIPSRNFFPYLTTADSYNLDRIDFARGANAVLFGAGGAGGTQNTGTKQANLARPFQETRIQVGSWNKSRITADVNQPLNERFGIRTNLLWQNGNTWREHEWERRQGAHLAATFKVTRDLSLRGEFEYKKTERLQGLALLRDNLSAWDGVTTPDGPVPSLTAAQLARAGIARFPSRFVTHPSFPGEMMNFQNFFRTQGAQHSTTAANTNYLDGVPIRTVGFSLRNQAMIDVWDRPERYAAVQRGARSFVVPTREESPIWDGGEPTYVERGRDLSLYANYKLGDFFFELAGNANHSPRMGNNAQRRGMQDTFIDLNRTLPNGASNPYFLERYSEYMEYMSDRRDDFTSGRAQVAWVKDTRLGKLQLGGMAGSTEHETRNRSRMLILPLTHLAPDARSWIDASELNEYGAYTRVYHNEKDRPYRAPNTSPIAIIDPNTNTRTTVKPTWVYDTRREDNNLNSLRQYEFLQAAGNLDLFRNRLVLIGAFRRDYTLLASNRVISPGDNPAGWDGSTLTLRKTAPGDYRSLTYFPKDASGRIVGPETPADARPRIATNGANIPAAQYANDRFRDDFDAPSLKGEVDTHTLGAVVNLTKWLGVYGNVATTFNLISPSQNAAGQLLPPTSSEGKDAGMRLTLPNGRLALSLGWYSAFQAGSTVLVGDGFQGAYNAIADAPVLGDLTPAGRNARGVRRFPQNVWSTVTEETTGYEAELTANLTPQWRVVLNGGYTDANRTDQFPDIIEYFKSQDGISREILRDAGVIIDPTTRRATIDPRYDNDTALNQIKVQSAVNGWNNLQDTVIPNFTARSSESQRVPQSVEWTGNLATDYRFREGWVKGLRVGLGINYRGGQVVGFRGSDTIPDPANPNNAIDDPTVDALTPVIAPSYYKGVLTLSYTLRMPQNRRLRSIQFDLNVDNLFNRREAVFGTSGNNSGSGTTVLVPRNGDITSPARVTIPGNFFYLAPRNYTVAAKFNF